MLINLISRGVCYAYYLEEMSIKLRSDSIVRCIVTELYRCLFCLSFGKNCMRRSMSTSLATKFEKWIGNRDDEMAHEIIAQILRPSMQSFFNDYDGMHAYCNDKMMRRAPVNPTTLNHHFRIHRRIAYVCIGVSFSRYFSLRLRVCVWMNARAQMLIIERTCAKHECAHINI